jgi:hypothetical protein
VLAHYGLLAVLLVIGAPRIPPLGHHIYKQGEKNGREIQVEEIPVEEIHCEGYMLKRKMVERSKLKRYMLKRYIVKDTC